MRVIGDQSIGVVAHGADGSAVGAADIRAFDPGYVMTGRVRISQVNMNYAAYSQSNLGGVVDGFVVATTDLVEDGDIGELWTVTMLVAVPRG